LEAIDRYGIVTPSIHTLAKLLSGGNIQRLILARELTRKPKIIIAAHPTAGLDVKATEQIQNLLLKEKERGVAILLVSEDLDEIFNLSDRIAVMFRGKIMGILEVGKVSREEIGLMMAGEKVGQNLLSP
jgi:simple sugar transport system ATP-binding protein